MNQDVARILYYGSRMYVMTSEADPFQFALRRDNVAGDIVGFCDILYDEWNGTYELRFRRYGDDKILQTTKVSSDFVKLGAEYGFETLLVIGQL